MKMLQAYTGQFEKVDYAILEDEFVVDFHQLVIDENHWKFVKRQLDRRNMNKANCRIGKIDIKES